MYEMYIPQRDVKRYVGSLTLTTDKTNFHYIQYGIKTIVRIYFSEFF